MTIDLTAYVASYLTSVGGGSWDSLAMQNAMKAEQIAQRRFCSIPADHTVTVDTVSASTTVTVTTDTDGAFLGYDVGATVTGTGIPADTYILSVDLTAGTALLSEAATADGSAIDLAVAPDLTDLAEALARRVAANLANRNLPLGVQTQVAEFGSTANRVGGRDREVARLEAPYRDLPAG